MGRQLFDYSFREYARRWAFKHPTPADLFRTLEDASGEDLDWFWRGWFYGTEACDISLDTVKYAKADVNAVAPGDRTLTINLSKPLLNNFEDVSKIRNREDKNIKFQTDVDTSTRDFYWRYDRNMEKYDTTKYTITLPATAENLDAAQKESISSKNFYELTLSNKGGLVMPVIIEWTYKDGTKEVDRIPAQVWRYNENKITKLFFMKDKEVASIKLDPMRETADINESNNSWGSIPEPSKFSVFKQKQNAARGQSVGTNPMQKAEEKKGF